MNDWQIVNNASRRKIAATRMYASLNRRGEIVINPAAWNWIGDTANVTLMYDPEKNWIGVKWPVPLDQNFFRVRRYGRGKRQRIVRARRLLEQFGLKLDKTVIFRNIANVLHNRERMLVLDLNLAEPIVRR